MGANLPQELRYREYSSYSLQTMKNEHGLYNQEERPFTFLQQDMERKKSNSHSEVGMVG